MRYISHTTTNQPFAGGRQRLLRMVTALKPGKEFRGRARKRLVRPRAYQTTQGGLEPRHISTNKGHLIALRYGGPDIADNMVPMYGRFNKNGPWSRFERELRTFVDVTVGGPVNVTITCHYSTAQTDDQRIPIRFDISAVATTGKLQKNWPLPHPTPRPIVTGQDVTEKVRIEALQAEIIRLDWRVEDQLDLESYADRRALPVLPDEIADRPYAFLDYEEWRVARLSDSGLRRWKSSIMNESTKEFNDQKRAKLCAANRILNDGGLISDYLDDPVFGGPPWGDQYRYPGGPPGLLVLGGNDLEPEVDHIIPQSMGGFSIFSNAALCSTKKNSLKRAAVKQALRDKIRQSAKGNPTKRKKTQFYSPGDTAHRDKRRRT